MDFTPSCRRFLLIMEEFSLHAATLHSIRHNISLHPAWAFIPFWKSFHSILQRLSSSCRAFTYLDGDFTLSCGKLNSILQEFSFHSIRDPIHPTESFTAFYWSLQSWRSYFLYPEEAFNSFCGRFHFSPSWRSFHYYKSCRAVSLSCQSILWRRPHYIPQELSHLLKGGLLRPAGASLHHEGGGEGSHYPTLGRLQSIWLVFYISLWSSFHPILL